MQNDNFKMLQVQQKMYKRLKNETVIVCKYDVESKIHKK